MQHQLFPYILFRRMTFGKQKEKNGKKKHTKNTNFFICRGCRGLCDDGTWQKRRKVREKKREGQESGDLEKKQVLKKKRKQRVMRYRKEKKKRRP
ncbi:hypothetical protein BSKO_10410 [Bryopsis sp. KO-2023]|nr:hypothetical protein BSKO_10410 [Bryopsis sp. KO-2023]